MDSPLRVAFIASLLALASALAAQTPRTPAARASAPAPRTRPELTDYRETSRYDDVTAFVAAVTQGRRNMHVTRLGYSFEGRALPLVVVGNVADASPDAVKRSGKLRVYIQANIHAGEVEGKEAALMLLRDLAAGGHARWADSLVLLIAPTTTPTATSASALPTGRSRTAPSAGWASAPTRRGSTSTATT